MEAKYTGMVYSRPNYQNLHWFTLQVEPWGVYRLIAAGRRPAQSRLVNYLRVVQYLLQTVRLELLATLTVVGDTVVVPSKRCLARQWQGISC